MCCVQGLNVLDNIHFSQWLFVFGWFNMMQGSLMDTKRSVLLVSTIYSKQLVCEHFFSALLGHFKTAQLVQRKHSFCSNILENLTFRSKSTSYSSTTPQRGCDKKQCCSRWYFGCISTCRKVTIDLSLCFGRFPRLPPPLPDRIRSLFWHVDI